ncbi:hypothetical protein Taro_026206 [Colocasia esculenta]|uniref:Cation/H+ exchanger domain-containing protein n=1 Tax=Colocasia esculenta TaxID=4460 RepID=A0A843VAU3_COLES|nr:hypothetical protein [Colocasia esculenta]
MDPTPLEFNKNVTLCFINSPVSSAGFWLGDNPLRGMLPLVMLQISMIVICCRIVHSVLRRLGQVEATCQIIVGILLGPSLAGSIPWFRLTFFPKRSWMHLITVSQLGYVLFMFLVGVKTDLSLILKSGRKAMAVGLAGIFAPLALVFLFRYALGASIPLGLTPIIRGVAMRWCMTAFPVVSHTLAELRLLNSSVGRIALSASLLSNFVFVIGVAILSPLEVGDRATNQLSAVLTTSSCIVLALVSVFVVRVVTLWMIRKTPPRQPLQERDFAAVLVMAFGCGILYELMGYNVSTGMFMVGLALPSGPPLGTTLVRRLEGLVSDLFLPVFLAMGGFKTLLSAVTSDEAELKYLQLFLVLIMAGKVIGIMAAALCNRMRLRNAFALALVMNVRGINEVGALNLWQNDGMAGTHTYGMGIIFIVASAGIVTPLLKRVYRPSVTYGKTNARNVQQSKHDAELRVLACVHGEEDVAPIVDVLQAVRPAAGGFQARPICIYLLHLIQLAGRSAALLAPHRESNRRGGSRGGSSVTDHIVHAFRHIELGSHASVYPFVSISPYATMHLDICALAQEKNVAMLILPYHKRAAVHGAAEVTGAHRGVNASVLSYAPCSVGILVNHRPSKRPASTVIVPSRYDARMYVAVYFLGGPDDREALSFAARMVGNPKVFLTLVRLRRPTGCAAVDAEEDRHDDQVVDEFLLDSKANERVACCEEVVQNGEDIIGVIRDIGNEFNLVIVGRRQGMESPLTAGMADWSENPELGVLGDMFASTDLLCTAATLVVQQSRAAARRQPKRQCMPKESNPISRCLHSSSF